MELAPFQYHAPRSLDEAIALLGRHAEDGCILAGGQSLLPQMGSRLAAPGHLIDINAIDRLDRISESVGRVKIPPLLRHLDLETAPIAPPLGPLLQRVARCAGPRPVRSRGTVCGSLAHGHGKSAWCIAALALGADIVVRSQARGARTIPARGFFLGALTTAMDEDEMIVEVQVPLLSRHVRWGFAEIGRHGFGWPEAVAIAVCERDEGDMHNVRIALGGIEGTAARVLEAETLLERAQPMRRGFREAARAAADAVDPVGEPGEDANYRRDLARAAIVAALDQTLA